MPDERTSDPFLTKPSSFDGTLGVPFAPVPSSNVRASSFSAWHTKLAALATLTQGWNGYSAPSPQKAAIENATSYLKASEEASFEPTRVEASVMGGVGITHRHEKKKVYVEFYNEGTVHSLFSAGPSDMTTIKVEATPDGYKHIIEKARSYLHA